VHLAHDPRRLEPREPLTSALAGVPHHDHVETGSRRAVRRSTALPARHLEANGYEEAKQLCLANGWRRPSMQSFGMRHRILEIEPLAKQDPRVLEVHPESSFREFAGHTLPTKRSVAGAIARESALASAGIAVRPLAYPLDDVLYAAVAAWSTLRYATGAAEPLHAGHHGRDGVTPR
jgi:predicted RNase H-like nuclease